MLLFYWSTLSAKFYKKFRLKLYFQHKKKSFSPNIFFGFSCFGFFLIFAAFKKQVTMATAIKKKSSQTARIVKMQSTEYQEPKRLSKIGQWLRDNPGGIITVMDRRAVNR